MNGLPALSKPGALPAANHELRSAIQAWARAHHLQLDLPVDLGDDLEVAMRKVAERNTLPLICAELPSGWWQQDIGPFLTEWNDAGRRRVAALTFVSGQYRLADELDGSSPTGTDALIKRSCRYGWFLAESFDREEPQQLSTKDDLLRWALEVSRRSWTKAALPFSLCITASILLSFSIPLVLSKLIDVGLPVVDTSFSLGCFCLLIIFNFAQCLLAYSRMKISLAVQSSMSVTVQSAMTWHLLRLPFRFFRDQSSGDIAYRNTLVSNVSWQVGTTVLESIISGTTATCSLVVAAYLSPALLAIALPLSFLESIIYFALIRKSRRQFVKLEIARSELVGRVVSAIRSITLLKSTGREKRIADHLGSLHSTAVDRDFQVQMLDSIRKVVGVIMPAAGMILVFNASYFLVAEKAAAISLGTIAGFIAAYRTFSSGLNGVAGGVAELIAARSQMQLVEPMLSERPDSNRGKTCLPKLRGSVSFTNVTYKYPGSDTGIENASFQILEGQFVGIAGGSGSGKSTLIRLLLGIESPQSGTIEIDGVNIQSLNMNSVRAQIGSVLQSARLIQGTIGDNICFGRTIEPSKIYRALTLVEMLETVQDLPMGVETVVSQSGTNFSGGQCQRLLIARAIAAEPKLLVLDESLSGLDVSQQRRILARLKQAGITVVLVSHRIEAFNDADLLLTISGGQVSVDRAATAQR